MKSGNKYQYKKIPIKKTIKRIRIKSRMKTNKGGWNHKKKINFKNNPKWKKIVIKLKQNLTIEKIGDKIEKDFQFINHFK